MALVAPGLSNDEIATRMVISPTTAKTHVSRAMTKLRARDRAQLVVFAYRDPASAPHDAPGSDQCTQLFKARAQRAEGLGQFDVAPVTRTW